MADDSTPDNDAEPYAAVIPTVDPEKQENRTATFFSDDGSILRIESVEPGVLPAPPSLPEISYENIFLRWDYPDTATEGDVEIYPVYQTISGMQNAFVIPGAYGKCGETINLPLRLCGEVTLCGFDLAVEYDPEVLQLISVYGEDDSIMYNDETPGVVRINYVSVSNTTADIDICFLQFKILAESGELPVALDVKSIYAWDEEEAMYVPEYQKLDGCIYVWSE